MNLGIVGATGQVGSVLLSILEQRNSELSSLRLFATERSTGKELTFQGKTIVVENASTADYSDLDVVIFSAGGDTSKELAPKVVEDGPIVIDNSSAWRMDPDVPLVVIGANDHDLSSIPKGIIANPNCTTMAAMPAMKLLHDHAGLKAMIVSTYQATSGSGLAGVNELTSQIKSAGDASGLSVDSQAVSLEPVKTYVEPIAYNMVPYAGDLVTDGTFETTEEQKLRFESRKILNIPDLLVSPLCVRIPTYTGHGLSISASFERPISVDDAIDIIENGTDIILDEVPTALKSTGRDETFVGRIRPNETVENGISLFIVGDNLRKGAALNTVQIFESLAEGLN